MAYKVQAKIASRRYHVYKNVNWDGVKANDKVAVEIEANRDSLKIDPYACAVKAMVGNPEKLETVGHVPREISRHVYFFLKEEGGKVDGYVLSTQYRPSPIPAGGLEIPLLLNFKSPRYVTHQKMKDFLTKLYSWDFEGSKTTEDEDDEEKDEEINFDIENDEEESSEVIKPKKKRKPPIIDDEDEEEGNELSDEEKQQDSDSEVIRPKIKQKPPKIVDYSSDEIDVVIEN